MAGFDTSDVAAHVGQGIQPSNPLQTIEQLAGTQNALNQNRMFTAKAAAGAILQQSIGPDGQPDLGKFSAGIRSDPRTAPFAPEILQDAATLQGTGITNQTNQQALAAKQFSTLQSALAQTGSDAEVASVIHRLVESGQVSPKFAAEAAGGNIEGLDMASIGALRKQAIMAAGNAAELNANVGTVSQINTGGKSQSVLTKVGPGGATVEKAEGDASALPMTQSPEAMGALVSYVDKDGVTHQVPRSAIETATGQPKTDAAGLTDEHGALATSLPPGVSEGRAAPNAASGQQLAADRAAVGSASAADQSNAFHQIDQLLSAPEGNTGPGTQAVNGWRNFMLANLPWLKSVIPGSLNEAQIQSANADELKKYMVKAGAAAASQYGPGTNEKLAVAASGNPNTDMSTLANRDVNRVNMALYRAQQAKVANYSGNPEDYSTYAAGWNRNVDPRAFMLDTMTKEQRQKVMSTITTTAQQRAFLRGKQEAEKAGIFADSDIPR